jgi:hypothetical protein
MSEYLSFTDVLTGRPIRRQDFQISDKQGRTMADELTKRTIISVYSIIHNILLVMHHLLQSHSYPFLVPVILQSWIGFFLYS